jgi:hypothetical protein
MNERAHSEELQELKRAIGFQIRKLREAKAMKRRSVVVSQPWLTGAKLRKYERGVAPLPLCLLAKLFEQYGTDAFMEFQLAVYEAGDRYRASIKPQSPSQQ